MKRLNKLQYAWIKKLKSGTTRKGTRVLRRSNTFCCLGVGAKVCNPKKPVDSISFLPDEFVTALGLKSDLGEFDPNKVSDKWLTKIRYFNTLAELNDETSMSHIEIGKFIDENREAVFTNV